MSALKDENGGADSVVKPPLGQAVGYVVVVIIGLSIAFGMWSTDS